MLGLSLVLVTAGLALTAATPTSPGECKPLSSLSFTHPPTTPTNLSTHLIYNGLTKPRGLRLDALSNLLVIDRGVGIVALSFRNDSTCVGWEKRTVVNNGNLNHGIEVGPGGRGGQYVYASTSDDVLRWEYDPGSVAVMGDPVTIASNMSNSAEELNRISLNNISSTPDAQKFYGYPWCYTAWDSSALASSSFTFQTGAQFSNRNPPQTPDDAWCSADQNNKKPALSMQSHSAPLDIVIYNAPSNTSEGYSTAKQYAVNTEWDGDAFVSFHGSWNREPPTGYKVVRIPWNNGAPAASANSRNGYETVVGAPDLSQCPNGCIRPVGLVFDRLGRLFVSSDTTGEIFVVENANAPDVGSSSSSAGFVNGVNLARALGVVGILLVGLI